MPVPTTSGSSARPQRRLVPRAEETAPSPGVLRLVKQAGHGTASDHARLSHAVSAGQARTTAIRQLTIKSAPVPDCLHGPRARGPPSEQKASALVQPPPTMTPSGSHRSSQDWFAFHRKTCPLIRRLFLSIPAIACISPSVSGSLTTESILDSYSLRLSEKGIGVWPR